MLISAVITKQISIMLLYTMIKLCCTLQEDWFPVQSVNNWVKISSSQCWLLFVVFVCSLDCYLLKM